MDMNIKNKKTKTPRPNTVSQIDYDKTDAGSIMLSFLLFIIVVAVVVGMFKQNDYYHEIRYEQCMTKKDV